MKRTLIFLAGSIFAVNSPASIVAFESGHSMGDVRESAAPQIVTSGKQEENSALTIGGASADVVVFSEGGGYGLAEPMATEAFVWETLGVAVESSGGGAVLRPQLSGAGNGHVASLTAIPEARVSLVAGLSLFLIWRRRR